MVMERQRRSAAAAGEAKRQGLDDPGYDSDDCSFECYLDHDTTISRYPCRVEAQGDGFNKAIFVDPNGEDDGDDTEGVHWDPQHGQGHGIWRRVGKDSSTEANPTSALKSSIKKVSSNTIRYPPNPKI